MLWQLVFGGQPFEELLQGTVLVAGVGAAVAVQQPAHPLLDVPAVHLLPAGPASLAEQVGGAVMVFCLFFLWRAIRSPASRPGGTKSGRTSIPGA